jgi:hypothetical protein
MATPLWSRMPGSSITVGRPDASMNDYFFSPAFTDVKYKSW